jgi:hypothetical protein
VFAVDVLGFAILSNHLYVVLWNRPDVVAACSDDEVARRWWAIFPQRRERDGFAAAPQESDLAMITVNPKRLAEIRRRLSSIRWLMRCVAEPIARRSNREDECSGRFSEGRFKCQHLLDDAAVAACMAYVDLNPIRAAIATTPESSRFTSACVRIRGEQQSAENVSDSAGA